MAYIIHVLNIKIFIKYKKKNNNNFKQIGNFKKIKKKNETKIIKKKYKRKAH